VPHRVKSLLRALIFAGAVLAPAVASGQSSSTGAAAFVNGAVISNYDLDQRTALFAATSGARPTEASLAQLRAQVLRSLEDEMIQLQEASKHRISVTKTEVDRAINEVSKDNNITPAQLADTLTKAGVSTQTFAQQISAQIIWQKVVTARYGTDVLISDQDVDEAMNRLKQGSDKPQFLLSEIYLGVDRAEDDPSVRASAEQFAQQIMQGVSFAIVAGQFSQSPSASDGGDIGGLRKASLRKSSTPRCCRSGLDRSQDRSAPKAGITSCCCVIGASPSGQTSLRCLRRPPIRTDHCRSIDS
jgi:peptidyl-prolyl cis-trans isomerase SurA